jgi:deazaflavin-dependent oxidoreductase (nitroreductase family)
MNATGQEASVRVVPRPLIRIFWVLHRAAHRLSGGRFGLTQPEAGGKFGMMRLATVGRRSGKPRIAIVGYIEDGPNLATIAMNGWGTSEPAWWLNLRSNPDAVVGLTDGPRAVRARPATAAERDRLWSAFRGYDGWGGDIDAFATRRPMETAVVVFEPRTDGSGNAHALDLPGHERQAPGGPSHAAASPLRSASNGRRLRLRHAWLIPGLAIMAYANLQVGPLGVGILPILVFGIAPDLPRLIGLGQPTVPGRMATRAVTAFNLMHHPAPAIVLVALGAVGVIPPALYVGGLAWIGHIVVGLGVGDRVRHHDGSLPPLWPDNRRPPAGAKANAGAPRAESPA